MVLDRSIVSPHPDVELGFPRGRLNYRLVLPEAGITENTGLIVVIQGYGMAYGHPYLDKLSGRLSTGHDCACVVVDYHGSALTAPPELILPHVPADIVERINHCYQTNLSCPPGASGEQFLVWFLGQLSSRGINHLDARIKLDLNTDEYNSFGLMPALDILDVVADVFRSFPLCKGRTFAIGTSYGGYIALLLSKLAPNTFRFIVDNSGFTSPADDMDSVLGGLSTVIGGVRLQMRTKFRWSDDPAAPTYFSSSRFLMRSILELSHFTPTSTKVYSFHSVVDTIAPVAKKVEASETLKRKMDFSLTRIKPADIDGRIFKTMEHGMKASLMMLFEICVERYLDDPRDIAVTDFDLGTQLQFPCDGLTYRLSFSSAGIRLGV